MTPADPSTIGRRARLISAGTPTGLTSVADAAALSSAGFEPVSEVIGAVANTVSPGGFYYPGRPQWNPPPGVPMSVAVQTPITYKTFTSSSGDVRVGTPPTIIALRSGYRSALARLTAEARAVRADGVVGVKLTRTVGHYNGTELWRFLAVGTAVRSIGRSHTDQPFTTDLTGAQVGSAVRAGWLPVSLLVVPCMGIRWIDPGSRVQLNRLTANAEVDAYADLVNTSRHQARQDFAAAARACRADAAVLSSMSMHIHVERPEPVCTAVVTVTGTAMCNFRVRPAPSAPLTILPLRARGAHDG